MLWKLKDVATATGGKLQQNNDSDEIKRVIHDSRNIRENSLFIALIGPNNDGHDFIEQSFEKGANSAIVSKDWWEACEKDNDKISTKHNFIIVDDTQKALEDLARVARKRTDATVIGITGSVGKTSTKEFLANVLQEQGKCHASEKSFNNHWGVPLTLANMEADCDFAVVEMGINHTGEMQKLTEIVGPDIAIITTIEPAHIGNFTSVEDIARAKAEIFTNMSSSVKNGGVAILNADNPYTRIIEKIAEENDIGAIYKFGETGGSDAKLKDCTLLSDSSKVTTKIFDKKHKYKLPVPGKHFVMNSLAILLTIEILGLDMAKAIDSLKQITPVEGRGNHILVYLDGEDTPITVIDESYNASPISMKAALKVLEMTKPEAGGRRIVVLGDMLELGAEGPKLHIELVNPVLKAKTDLVFACGPLMEALYNIVPPEWQGAYAEDSRKLASFVKEEVKAGDVILIKGSLGSRMAYVVQALWDMNCRSRKKTDKSNSNAEKEYNHAV